MEVTSVNRGLSEATGGRAEWLGMQRGRRLADAQSVLLHQPSLNHLLNQKA